MNKRQDSLPHNFLAEKMILNCLLLNSEAVEFTIQNTSTSAFYFKNHQEIYKAICLMHSQQIKIDIVTLVSFLQDNGLLDKIGGVSVLLELTNQVPNITYLKEYLKLLNDKFLRRSLIKLGYEVVNSGYITNIPVENIVNDLENKVFKLKDEMKTEKITTSAEILQNIFLELKEKFLNPTLPGIPSGFYDLDLLTQGFQKSDLIVIAGRPSLGKTALSLTIILNVLKKNRTPILLFSLEMSQEQIMYRLLSMETMISQEKLKTGNLSKNDWIKLNKVIKIFSKLPIYIYDSNNLSVPDVKRNLKIVLRQHNELGLVIIDYLQLMQSLDVKSFNRVAEISEITRSLKNLAREFNLPIIILSQLSRNVETRISQKPILSDLRESGSIEQDSDLILMLYQNKLNTFSSSTFEIRNLLIAKQRNGAIGEIKLKFHRLTTKFLDLKKE